MYRSGWTFCAMKDVPQQTDGCSCGIFTLVGIESIMENLPLLHDGRIVNYLRVRYGVDIVEGCLYSCHGSGCSHHFRNCLAVISSIPLHYDYNVAPNKMTSPTL